MIVSVAMIVVASQVFAAGPDADWHQELAELRAQVAQQNDLIKAQGDELRALRGDAEASWMTERHADEVKALVREVLGDADLRASFAEGGMTAGYDNGFFLKAENDAFLMKIFGQLQARYVFSTSDAPVVWDEATDSYVGDDRNRGGFEISRARMGFKGHVVDPSWQYLVWMGHNSSGEGFLLDATVTKVLEGGLSITVGQFKVPLWREWLVSETRGQMIERSLVHAEFSGSYTQGVVLSYTTDAYRLVASINDGAGAFNSPWGDEQVEGLAMTGRAEVMLAGTKWANYADYEGMPEGEQSLVLGLAGHYQQGEYGTSDDEARTILWSADLSAEFDGANLSGAIVGRHISDVAGTDNMNQLGLIVQGGLFVAPDLELVARYEWGDLDTADVEDLSILTVGVNKFIDGHRVKLSADVGYSFNAVGADWASSSTGWRGDAADNDGQVVIRSQAQLLF